MKNPFFDIDNWKEITATLSRNKTRTFLTAFGIFWGTAMLSLLWGGSKGLQDVLSRNFAGLSANTAICFTNKTTMPYKGYAKGMVWSLTQTDIENVRNRVPEIDALSGVSSRSTTAVYRDHSKATQVQGVEEQYTKIFTPVIYEGRFINESDEREMKKVCVIGKALANEIFGNESPVGKFIALNNIYYRIVGVAGQLSEVDMNGKIDEMFIIPHSTLRQTYNMGQNVDMFMLTAKRGYKPADLIPRIHRIIRANHPIHPEDKQALQFFDISEMFETVDNMFTGVDILVLFVGFSSLLAGIIGVGNIMWIIVKERTQEIGIRRALGAKPRDIIVQILSESVVLTTIAGIAGICFAVLVLSVVADQTTVGDDVPRFQLSFTHAMIILATFLTLGTAAGIIPALKAMHIKPIEALNDK